MARVNILELLAKSNEFKEGDLLVGGTRDELERKEARRVLSGLRLCDISSLEIVNDSVSEALHASLDLRLAQDISSMTFEELKATLLGLDGIKWVRRYAEGLSSEQIACVAKLMTNEELSAVSRMIYNPIPGKGITIGSSTHFGSRIQPNSPGDDEDEILYSILEGLTYGCGDVILGINPASDDLETIARLEKLLESVVKQLGLPTRYCVLSDIVKQSSVRVRTQVDVGFQSLAGTSKALYGMVGLDPKGLVDLARGFAGLYFETGQGSALTNHAAEGADMVTLEARNYGLARHIRKQTGSWMIVNDVAGFIGPEVFKTPDQLLRACLEDTVMAKLHGVSMGLDVCSTFHMGIDPETLRDLTQKIAAMAAPAYLMAVAGNADPMLGYMTTSFREHPRLRRQTGRQITSSMKARFVQLGIMDNQGELLDKRPDTESLYASYMKGGGDKRSIGELQIEAKKKMTALRERGFDLGYGHDRNYEAPRQINSRMKRIYDQARLALYATIDDSVIKDSSHQSLRVRTGALNRDEYLSHPQSGEHVRREDEELVARLYSASSIPWIQIVVSDGLNANAVNENLRDVLPALRSMLSSAGFHVGEADIFVENGRVRAGYHIGGLLKVDLIIHLIGERPGTGLNTLSAYLTYGRDASGSFRWTPSLDHSNTNAICGIHHMAKRQSEAAGEIASCAMRILREHRSGIDLGRV